MIKTQMSKYELVTINIFTYEKVVFYDIVGFMVPVDKSLNS